MKMKMKATNGDNYDVFFYGVPHEVACELVVFRDYVRRWSDSRGEHKQKIMVDKSTSDLIDRIVMMDR